MVSRTGSHLSAGSFSDGESREIEILSTRREDIGMALFHVIVFTPE